METELSTPAPDFSPSRPEPPLAVFTEKVLDSLREVGLDPAADLTLGRLIRQIRRRTRMTQTEFARCYGIPVGTFRDWEQDRACPDATARSYLILIAKAPENIAALFGR